MSREPTCQRRVPFSVVDEAVYLLDNEVEPWSVQLEVRVAGHLDEARLRTALAEALARHPMARAKAALEAKKGPGPVEVPAGPPHLTKGMAAELTVT